jgi:hypothetical protein
LLALQKPQRGIWVAASSGVALIWPEIICVQKNTGYSGYTGYNPHEYWRFLLPVVTAVTFHPTLLGLLLSGPEIVCVQKNTGYSGYTSYNPHEYRRFLLPVVTAVTFRPTLCPPFPFPTVRQEREEMGHPIHKFSPQWRCQRV